MNRAGVLSALLAMALPAGAAAQRAASLGGGGFWETYRFSSPEALEIESLSLVTVPVTWQASTGRLRLRLAGAWAHGSLARADGTESNVSGLTDTELSVQYEVRPNMATLTAVVLLPTGKETLTYDEVFVAGAIAADLLPFRITNWGTGGGAGVQLAVTRPIGGFAAGVSAGYVVARTFEPLTDETFEYRPGNQFHVRAAVDHVIGRSAKAAVQAGYERFGADQGDGQNLFQSGDRWHVTASLDFAAGNANGVAYAGWSRRGEGDFAEPQVFLPPQQVAFAGIALRSPLGRSVLQPSAELRLLDSDAIDRRGYTAGLGAAWELPAGSTQVIPSVKARFGRVEARDAAATGFTGAELGVAIRFGGVPR